MPLISTGQQHVRRTNRQNIRVNSYSTREMLLIEKYRMEAGARTCDVPHDSSPAPTL